MRKALVAVMIAALAVGMVAPADAAKKTKKGSFSADALPYPDPTEGCLNSIEGVNKHSEPLKVPFNGVLEATMLNFDGDWDFFVTDPDGNEVMSGTESQLQGAPPEETVMIGVSKGQELLLVPCNWAGGPSAEVEWSITSVK